jgi:hypothetical protein
MNKDIPIVYFRPCDYCVACHGDLKINDIFVIIYSSEGKPLRACPRCGSNMYYEVWPIDY